MGTLSWPQGDAPLRTFAQRHGRIITLQPSRLSARPPLYQKGGAGGGSQPLEDISMASPIHPQLCNLMAVESTARNLWLLRRRSGGLGLTTVADPQIIGRGEVPVYPVESRITLPLWLVAHSRSSVAAAGVGGVPGKPAAGARVVFNRGRSRRTAGRGVFPSSATGARLAAHSRCSRLLLQVAEFCFFRGERGPRRDGWVSRCH